MLSHLVPLRLHGLYRGDPTSDPPRQGITKDQLGRGATGREFGDNPIQDGLRLPSLGQGQRWAQTRYFAQLRRLPRLVQELFRRSISGCLGMRTGHQEHDRQLQGT